ncbi:hypothetical protein NAT51_06190 [Flavobacterium amniphilum]|uniref:hypothetical protein n=1 Tax=Flavobacterium amniphilum TaxID=1834035 RepID=UPI00202A7475|nr:hypothetical protein [Flavobacterium amniphilum]MCL9805099.1 hypothetical protein [Flavobacterium amniphilum]
MLFLDVLFTAIHAKSEPRSKFDYLYKLKNKKFDYVFLGSSRVANNIDADLVNDITNQKSINLGIEGANYDDNLLELKILLHNKNKIGRLYLQVDHFYENSGKDMITKSNILPYVREDHIVDHFREAGLNYSAYYYIPFYRYTEFSHVIGTRELFLRILNKKSKIDYANGFIPKYGNNDKIEVLPEYVSKSNKSISRIQNLCKKTGIELKLFCAPFKSNTINLNYIHKLKSKYPELIDFSEFIADKYFFDGGHLNYEGARIFTKEMVLKSIKKE